MANFRFGGSGGHNYKGSFSTSGKGGVRFRDVELKRFMQDLKKQFPKEIQEIIVERVRESTNKAINHGFSMTSETRNYAYDTIAESLSYKEIEHGAYKGARMFPSPEPYGPVRGKDNVKLAILYSKPRSPWAYGFETEKKEKMLVISSRKFTHRGGFTSPLLIKKGKAPMFPGIGGSSHIKVYDYVGVVEKDIEENLQRDIENWLFRKFGDRRSRR